MGKIMHSIPWTLALAMAQAGNAEDISIPSPDAVLLVLESGLSDTGNMLDMLFPPESGSGESGPEEE